MVISTHNRSRQIEAAVASVLANKGKFDLHIIDQGPGKGVRTLLEPFLDDYRFHYHRSHSRGAAAGRNLGVMATAADIVVFTDDDCIVPPDWVAQATKPFCENDNLGLLFGEVTAAEHDAQKGFIPTFECPEPTLISSIKGKNKMRGIAASAAVRRSAFLDVSGFDEMLGPGAPFHSNEEGDLTVRILLKGYDVLATPSFHAVHDGFRTFKEGRTLAWHNWLGIAGAYAKYLKVGRWSTAHIYFWELFFGALMQVFQNTFSRRRPGGVTPILAYLAGTFQCLMTPIDRQSLRFVTRDDPSGPKKGWIPAKKENNA